MSASAAAASMRVATRGRLQIDATIVGLTAALLLLGLVMVTSASVTLAARDGDPFFFLERQLLFALVGIGFGAIAFRIPTEAWERMSFLLLILAMLALVFVLVPGIGHSVNGSKRWIRLAGMNFQASEAARVLLLTYLCSYVVRREEEVRTTLVGFLKPLGVLGIAAVLLLVEPDMGSGVVLLATSMLVLLLAGVKLRHFFAVSLIGVGLGASIQKLFYLPEAHTDFVFAVLAEELGLVGIVCVVVLVLALVYRALTIARNAAEAGLKFPSYLAAAFGIWFGLQAFINMGVNMGLLPTKGLTLPLLSYGRSSLVVTLAWIGILLRVHHETQNTRSVALRSGAR